MPTACSTHRTTWWAMAVHCSYGTCSQRLNRSSRPRRLSSPPSLPTALRGTCTAVPTSGPGTSPHIPHRTALAPPSYCGTPKTTPPSIAWMTPSAPALCSTAALVAGSCRTSRRARRWQSAASCGRRPTTGHRLYPSRQPPTTSPCWLSTPSHCSSSAPSCCPASTLRHQLSL